MSGAGWEWRDGQTYLSHLSLLFLHGSQLIALRARFVGGRGSCSPGGGLVRERMEVEARCCFGGRWRAGDEEASWLVLASSGMNDAPPDRRASE